MKPPPIHDLRQYLYDKGGSDLHLATDLEPRIRIAGKLQVLRGSHELSESVLMVMMRKLAPIDEWRRFMRHRDAEFAYDLPGVARFRVNYFLQNNGPTVVLRIVRSDVRPLPELGVPQIVHSFTDLDKGLILVAGPNGSGMSTTLAAFIDAINRNHDKHIVTIEDPIEFVHQPLKSLLSQREIGAHTQSYATGIRAAMRQNADVIMVGALEHHEATTLAIEAAERGSLVLAAVNTGSSAKAIDRLVDAFPDDRREHAATGLARTLAAVVVQVLIPASDEEGRVAAHEVVVRAPGLGDIIRSGDTDQLDAFIIAGREAGMQSMDDALEALLDANRIAAHDAHRRATDKKRFAERLEG